MKMPRFGYSPQPILLMRSTRSRWRLPRRQTLDTACSRPAHQLGRLPLRDRWRLCWRFCPDIVCWWWFVGWGQQWDSTAVEGRTEVAHEPLQLGGVPPGILEDDPPGIGRELIVDQAQVGDGVGDGALGVDQAEP